MASGDFSSFPFAWESAAGCRSGYFEYLGGVMDPGDWIFAGEEYKNAHEFPSGYWPRLCEEWATDYTAIAAARDLRRPIRGAPTLHKELCTL